MTRNSKQVAAYYKRRPHILPQVQDKDTIVEICHGTKPIYNTAHY